MKNTFNLQAVGNFQWPKYFKIHHQNFLKNIKFIVICHLMTIFGIFRGNSDNFGVKLVILKNENFAIFSENSDNFRVKLFIVKNKKFRNFQWKFRQLWGKIYFYWKMKIFTLNFSDICRRQRFIAPKWICQNSSNRYHKSHDEMRNRTHESRLGRIQSQNIFEKFRLGNNEHVKSPGAAKVRDDNRPNGHRRSKWFPRCWPKLKK